MSLSRYQIELVLEEIKPKLLSGHIQQISLAHERIMSIKVRCNSQNYWLNLNLNPDSIAIYLTTLKISQSVTPSSFIMALRKRIKGSKIRDVELLNHDRIIKIYLEKKSNNDIGVEPFFLILELTGRHFNFFLLDSDERIINLLKSRKHGNRKLSVGHVYILPESPPVKWLKKSKTDPLNLMNLTTELSRSRCVEEFYQTKLLVNKYNQIYKEVENSLNKQLLLYDKRIKSFIKNLERAKSSQQYKQWAELLMQAYGQDVHGKSNITLKNYFLEDIPDCTIPLIPELDLQENINRYFKLFKKFNDSHKIIESQVENSSEHLSVIESSKDMFYKRFYKKDIDAHNTELSVLIDKISDFKEGLIKNGVLKRINKLKQSQLRTTSLPYKEYFSSTGHQILVGQSRKKNQELSIKIARGSDIWLHSRDWPGAHVIIRLNRKEELQQNTLLDGATLAAHFSKSNEPDIEVIYTYAKHLRTIKGSKEGHIQYSNIKSICIRVEKNRLNKLLSREYDLNI